MKKIVTRILLAILALAAIITGCIRLESITGPSSAALNSTFELTVNGSIKPETGYGPEGIALAILAPVEWNIRETAELSITTDGLGVFGVADVVDEPMSPIPADVALPKTAGNAGLEPYVGLTWAQAYYLRNGDMGNIGGDMEWVAFTNPTKVKVTDGKPRVNFAVKVKFKTTNINIKCRLAFEFAGEIEGWEGVGYKNNLTTYDIKVGNGSENYLLAPTVSTVPSQYRYNDFFSVNFVTRTSDGQNALYGEKDIYMNGTAVLSDGSSVTVTKKTPETRMDNMGDISFRKYIYPAHFFSLPKGKVITDLYFYFTNKDGSKVVKPEGGDLGYQFRQAAE